MKNIEDMMVMWKEMDSKLSALVEENKKLAAEIKKNKLLGNQERLIRKYRAFIIIEALCIPMIILLLIANPLVVDQYRWATLIYFVGFFLLEICIDGYLLYKLCSLDIYKDSIIQISRQAKSNWKIHKIGVLIGIPVAIGAVSLFCFAIGGNITILCGVFVGGIIGLAIGLNEFFKFMKEYKAITGME